MSRLQRVAPVVSWIRRDLGRVTRDDEHAFARRGARDEEGHALDAAGELRGGVEGRVGPELRGADRGRRERRMNEVSRALAVLAPLEHRLARLERQQLAAGG